MRVLIIGAMGFVGKYLLRELRRARHDIFAADLRVANRVSSKEEGLLTFECDIRNRDQVQKVILESQPDAVVNLAGVAHVIEAARDRARLLDVTVGGTENLCLAVTEMNRYAIPVLLISSSLVYHGITLRSSAVSEDTAPHPGSAYGCAKLAAEYALKSFESDYLRPYIVRAFNHIGPGQDPSFVCSGFARRIAKASEGAVIEVGNLAAHRDFSDVRDIVRAYRLILEKKPAPSLFVLGRGVTVSIQEIFNKLVAFSGKHVTAWVNPELVRRRDDADFFADIQRARNELGWNCEIPLDETLQDIYREAMELTSMPLKFKERTV